MRWMPALFVTISVGWAVPCAATYEITPQVRRETRLAIHMVRRYCQTDYILETGRISRSNPMWTWSADLMGDGRYAVSIGSYSWVVDVTAKSIEPGAAVLDAMAHDRLPPICSCVEGVPPPPPGWKPAKEPQTEPPSPGTEPPSPGTEPPSPGTEPPSPQTEPHAAAEKPKPRAPAVRGEAPSGRKREAGAGPVIQEWLPGTWQGPVKGAFIRIRFSSDGIWRRERLEPGPGGRLLLTLKVEGKWVVAGTAVRMTVTAVEIPAGMSPGERASRVGSVADAYCYRSDDGELIMLTSGGMFRAPRLRN